MPLNPLALTITTGSVGRVFAATLLGVTDGSTLEILPHPAGFYARNGRVNHPTFPRGLTSFTVRERHPTEGSRDTTLDVSGSSTDVLDPLAVTLPTTLTGPGSATIARARAGSTLTLATNPGGAWSLAGTTLSWTAAAFSVAERPAIIETALDAAGQTIARETRLRAGLAGAVLAIGVGPWNDDANWNDDTSWSDGQ